MYAAVGRFADAADALDSIAEQGQPSARSLRAAARLLRTAPNKGGGELPELEGFANFAYAYVGEPGRILDNSERMRQIGFAMGVVLWGPEFASLLDTARYKALVRANGLVDYWRARGWPDFCRPVGADDFDCD